MDNYLNNVTIIIPCYNEEKFIGKCLDSVIEQDYPKENIEVLVIDGMSDDGTRDIVNGYIEKYNNIRIIDNPAGIVPNALNLGIKSAKGEIIIRIDGHSTYAPDYIRKCVEILKRTGADNVGGPMKPIGDDYFSNSVVLAHNYLFGLGGAKFHNPSYEGYADTVYLGCWKRDVFNKYGYFNELLARNQDIEHNARIRKGGGKIFLTPEIKSYYYCRSNLKDLWVQNFRNGYWNIKTTKVAPGTLSLRHFVPLIFILSILTTWIFLPLWLSIIGGYLFINIISSILISIKNGLKYFLVLPIIFITLHFSYGIGSLF